MPIQYQKEIHTSSVPIAKLFPEEYEHPMDAACLKTLKMNSAFDSFTKFVMEYGLDRINEITHSGSNVKVTKSNMPYLYNCVKTGCEILDIKTIPTIYLVQSPLINAYTTNVKNPILCLTNSLLRLLSHEELMFIIGHELGHIKSEHVQYHTLGNYIPMLSSLVDIPYVGNILSSGLQIAFGEWRRSSEFTADRAGLLCCQDLKATLTATAKMGGYPEEYYDSIDLNEFIKQAQEFKGLDEDLYNKFMKMYINMQQTHPWTIYRARELMLWVQSGEYSRILHRCSSWFMQDIANEEEKTAKLETELVKLKASALVTEAKAKKERIEANLAKEKAKNAKGFNQVGAKAQEALEENQAKAAEAAFEKVKQQIAQAEEELKTAIDKTNEIKSVMKDVSETELENHISFTLGDLPIITE